MFLTSGPKKKKEQTGKMFMRESYIVKRTKSNTKIVPSMKAECIKCDTQKFEATLKIGRASNIQPREYFGLATFSEK